MEISSKNKLKTYTNKRATPIPPSKDKRKLLTTKNAVEYLVNGSLSKKVCRLCLHEAGDLVEMERILQVRSGDSFCSVSVRDMILSFYRFEILELPEFPSRICELCLNQTISSYLFTQQCEKSNRAIQNCFEDIYSKFDKLDPLDKPLNKRGRQKLYVNHNKIHSEHKNVVEYAEPLINMYNRKATLIYYEKTMTLHPFECLKCHELLPSQESYLNHEKIHPKSMWYSCRLCGKFFARKNHLKNHFKSHKTVNPDEIIETDEKFICNECGEGNENYLHHLQHIEKHKFKKTLQNVLNSSLDSLCTVCLEKKDKMADLEDMVRLYGATPELTGDLRMYDVLATTVPGMFYFENYTGTKVCECCINSAIDYYVFVQNSVSTRRRLEVCVKMMNECLENVKGDKDSVYVEVSNNLIVPVSEIEVLDGNLYADEDVPEYKLKIDVLEDEFRIKSESEDEEVKETVKIE